MVTSVAMPRTKGGGNMKTVDLTTEKHTLADVLELARAEDVLIHSASGGDFLLERADEFDREVGALGASDKFMSYLNARSEESEELTLKQVRDEHIEDE